MADFDPDAYLSTASKPGGNSAPSADTFNPDAYLASKQSGGATPSVPHEVSLSESLSYLTGLSPAKKLALFQAVVGSAHNGNPETDAMVKQGMDMGAPIAGAIAGSRLAPSGAGKIVGAGLGAMSAFGMERMLRAAVDRDASELGTPGDAAQVGVGSMLMPGAGKVIPTALKLGAGAVVARNAGNVTDTNELLSPDEDAKTMAISSLLGGAGAKLAQGTGPSTVADTVRSKNIRAFLEEGGSVPPAMSNPTFKNKALDYVGGRANIARGALVDNEATNVKLAKQAAGIPESGELKDADLTKAADAISEQYYKPISDQSPAAAKALQEYQDAKVAFDDAAAAKAATRTKAARLEQESAQGDLAQAVDNLKAHIGEDGFQTLKEGEVKYARNKLVEKAANTKAGSIDPAVIRNYDDRTGVLDGPLKKIADFHGAVGGALDKEATSITPPFTGRLFPAIGAGIGGSAGGLPGAVIGGALPIAAEKAAGAYQLSRGAQMRAAQPRYTPGAPIDNDLAKVMRFASIQAALQKNGR